MAVLARVKKHSKNVLTHLMLLA